MSLSKAIKLDAVLALKNNWMKTIGITFTWGIIVLAFCILDIIINLNFQLNINILSIFLHPHQLYQLTDISLSSFIEISKFMLIPFSVYIIYYAIFSILYMGDVLWNYSVIAKKDNDFFDLFYYYSKLKLILLSWNISIQIFFRKLFWAIIIFLPSVIIGTLSTYLIYTDISQYKVLMSFGYILCICLAVISIITCMIFFKRYSLIRYLMISGECTKVRNAVKVSTKIMKGKKFNYLIFLLSFLGWILSCVFIIPIFFVLPYIKMSMNLYARYLVEDFNINRNN